MGLWPPTGIARPIRPLMAFCHAKAAKLGRNCPKFAKGIDLSLGKKGTTKVATYNSFFFAIACSVIWLVLIFGHTT